MLNFSYQGGNGPGRRAASALVLALIHQSAWNRNSRKSGSLIGPELIHVLGSLCTTTTCRLAHPAWWASEAILTPVRARSMQDPANELRRIPLPKLFGKSEWVPHRSCESDQEGFKEPRSTASCGRRSVIEKPSAIFQTVSPRTRVNKLFSPLDRPHLHAPAGAGGQGWPS